MQSRSDAAEAGADVLTRRFHSRLAEVPVVLDAAAMTILYPPPLEPLQSGIETIRGQGEEHTSLVFRDYRVHIHGLQLSQTQLQSAIAGAQTLSDLVRQLAAVYHDAGHPLLQLRYALAGNELYVLALDGVLVGVEAPQPYRQYFEDLISPAALTERALERRRVLAAAHADRAGLIAEPLFLGEGESNRYTLDLRPHSEQQQRSSLRLGFDNRGNRFVGREFAELAATHTTAQADLFSAGLREGLSGNGEYHEQSLGWSRVTRYGLFGIAARNVGYQAGLPTDSAPVTVDGSIREARTSWSTPLAASRQTRWLIGAELSYNFKRLDAQTLLQRQELAVAEINSSYSFNTRLLGLPLTADAALSLKQGLGDDNLHEPTVQAELDYLLLTPRLALTLEPIPRWLASLDLVVQYTDQVLPEQAQWVLGGADNLNAYLPGVAVGDTGGLARLALNWTGMPTLGALILTPRGFVEYGYARFTDQPALPESPSTQSLADAGLGLDATYRRWLSASLAIAEGLYKDGFSNADLHRTDASYTLQIAVKF